jgi:ABC-2 type transport system ATP-binding protein
MIIETDNLTKRFLRHEAVQGVTLRVPPGAAFALIGANGAGKTTLLRMLVNILRPDSGSARVVGADSRRLSHSDYLRIGYVSENAKLPERLTIAQYFDYLRALYPNWDRQLETDLRRRLEMPPTRKLGKLSHGMRMKAMLIGALSFRPALLVLDEPLSGLDPLVRDEIMEGLLSQAGETTIVISSHELSEIENCVTHVAFMDKGKLLFQESIEALTARFREIDVVRSETARFGNPLPATWLSQESTNQTLRFVESAFVSNDDTMSKLSAHVGGFRHCEIRAMSLRDISKTLMRATRTESNQ